MSGKQPSSLPSPTAEAQAHSERVTAFIADEIARHGLLTFARYMQMALYQPGLGYYQVGTQKFSQGGDFVTAPELSPLFSWCIARQCLQILSQHKKSCILELGAGTGVMALEILCELEREACLPEYYFILEVSADLKRRQQELFTARAPQFLSRIKWLDSLPSEKIDGIILANEVVDAMPVHKFRIQHGIQEVCVGYKNAEFYWQAQPSSNPDLTAAVHALGDQFDEGYESEMNLIVVPWLQSVLACLRQGVMLLIDYGYPQAEYYHAQRSMGTLMCHFQHRAHDNPLILQGIQDITAHVDFTRLAETAVEIAEISGFTHQAGFLLNCGLMDFNRPERSALAQYDFAQQVKQLTLPSEMGEKFKALAISKEFDDTLLGFRQFDLLHKL